LNPSDLKKNVDEQILRIVFPVDHSHRTIADVYEWLQVDFDKQKTVEYNDMLETWYAEIE